MGEQRQYWYAIAAVVVIGSGIGWIGATLDFSTSAIVTAVLVTLAVCAVIGILVLAAVERRGRRSDKDSGR